MCKQLQATLFESMGLVRGLRFPPTLQYNAHYFYGANNVPVYAQSSIQYF
jgi:hypothetical protein